MVPRPTFNNSIRKSATNVEANAAESTSTFDLNKPTSVAEGLLQGLGRELWVAADELLAACACLTERVMTEVVVKQTFSVLSLARGALALRNAADSLMVMQWQGITDELELAAVEWMEFVPLKLMQHFAGLFVFFTPMPPSEWALATELLRYIGLSFKGTAKKVQEENLIAFRTESADALRRAGQSFLRASAFMGSAVDDDLRRNLRLPKDPRVAQGVRGELLSQGLDELSTKLLEESKLFVKDQSQVYAELDRVHKEVNKLDKQEDRHGFLLQSGNDCSPFNDMEEAVVADAAPPTLTIFVLSAKGLRNADWGGKSDPYCTVEFSDQAASQKMKTKVIDDTLNPMWNESFQVEYVPGKHLNFEVYDKDVGPKRDDLLGKVTLRNEIYFPRGYDGSLRLEQAGRHVSPTLRIAVFVPNAPARSLSQPVPKVDPEKFPVFLYIARLQGYDGLPLAVHYRQIQKHLKSIGPDPKRQDEVTSFLSKKVAEFDPARFPGKEADARHIQAYIQRLLMSDLKRWEFHDSTVSGMA
mmetsp:Transcript_66683/g.115913  ORF Transcript_66683/g.115913 Transcript_66683/m.115913 type:complete len:529 (+) Transcript_66683:61-1647(+)